MPFGVIGRCYVLQDLEEERRLRRQLSALFPIALIPLLAMASLWILPPSIRSGHQLQILGVAGISFLVFSIVFTCWVGKATRSLQRVDADAPTVAAVFDPMERAARAITDHLQRSEPQSVRLNALGALAGFACQIGVRAEAAASHRPSGLVEVSLRNGGVRYFGDALNIPLAEGTPSVWSILSDDAPLTPLLDVFRESAARATGEDPAGNYVKITALLITHWPKVATILSAHDLLPEHWHLALARAARDLLISTPVSTPQRTALMLMRSAILASKADPAEILVPDS